MKRKKGSSTGELIFDIFNYAILTIMLIICIYPFYYIFIYSISNPIKAQSGIGLLPKGLTLNNFAQIFKLKGIGNALIISVLRTLIGTIVTVLSCSFFAYLVTKEELPMRKLIYRFVVLTMYFNAGLIPWYLTMKFLHLNNNFLLYILPTAISAFYVVLLKTFIEQLPQSLEEAAKLDGAGYFTIFTKVILPLSKPILATIVVFASIAQWNTWFDNYFLVSSDKLKTLQLILYNYLTEASKISTASAQELTRGTAVRTITPETVRMTITMVVTLPILLVYPFMQRYFVKGIMLGAVKG